MKDSKIERFSSKNLSVHTRTTEYNSGMNQRIAEFERMWNARLPPPPQRLVRFVEPEFDIPQPVLRRQTNLHHIFPEELEQRWLAATAEERDNIEFEFQIMRGNIFDIFDT